MPNLNEVGKRSTSWAGSGIASSALSMKVCGLVSCWMTLAVVPSALMFNLVLKENGSCSLDDRALAAIMVAAPEIAVVEEVYASRVPWGVCVAAVEAPM